jgi:hypothetical protein
MLRKTNAARPTALPERAFTQTRKRSKVENPSQLYTSAAGSLPPSVQ